MRRSPAVHLARYRRLLPMVVAVMALTLAACGPGGSESGATAASVTVSVDEVKSPVTVKLVAADATVTFGSGVDVEVTLLSGGAVVPRATAAAVVGETKLPVMIDASGVGALSIPAAALVPGRQAVTVSYAGDSTHEAGTATLTVDVAPATAAVQLTLTPQADGRTVATAAVSTNTLVDSPGLVQFTLDGTALGGVALATGAATMYLPAGLPLGDHAVAVSFTPTRPAEVTAADGSAVLSITTAPSTVTATGHTDVVRYGDNGYVNVAVSAPSAPGVDLTGSVAVLDNGTPIAQGTVDATGVAQLEFYNTADPGTRTYTVSYAGTAVIVGSESPVTITTSQTNVDIAISTPKLRPGQSGTIAVSVIGTPQRPTGPVSVSVDGAEVASGELIDGQITAPISNLSAGSHAVKVTYGGDIRFEASTAAVSMSVKEPISNPNASAAEVINADNPCPSWAAACIDLTNERSWLQSGGVVTYGPVSITSGKAGHRTPTGSFSVYWKDKDHLSSLFNNAPMPNSVFFVGGVAFHAGSLSAQSHGCIHLSNSASETYFSELSVGDGVYVWGTPPY